jgi:cation diffusion facilitator CzcD-associated flavoprotein CzcO
LNLEDGVVWRARRVIVAAGIGTFAWRPSLFQCLPPSLVSHTSVHRDLSNFAGKSVLVVGGGQSALESAALLHEAGAQVEVIARCQSIHWLQGRLSTTLHHGLGQFTRNLLYAATDVGPAGLSQLMARPDLVKKLPRYLQDRLRERCIRPAGARWLVNRLRDVPMRMGISVVAAAPAGGRVQLKLDDKSERTADHVLLGTGYRVDIAKYPFLPPKLLQGIERHNGYPVLRRGFETSVPGLHMLGAPAAWSFGPLVQFVSGTAYTSRALHRLIAAKPTLSN